MKYVPYSLPLVILLLTANCGSGEFYTTKCRTLDSLGGVVNAMAGGLEKADTVFLQRSISRFTYYRQFIRQQVGDTLSRNEADVLRQFISAGERLEGFRSNRLTILARARLLNSQIRKLTADARERTVDTESLGRYLQQELAEAARLTEAGYESQKIFFQAQKDFVNSLKGVEQLIMVRNNGMLPTVIRDTLDF
jgi:hypothetical protein